MTILKLYHKDELIGTISNVAPEDTFEMSGDIALTAAALNYKRMFEYLTDEEALLSGATPPFEELFLEECYIEDESGKRREIACPGVYFADNEIFWRE